MQGRRNPGAQLVAWAGPVCHLRKAEHQKHLEMLRNALSLPLAGDGRSDYWMSIAAAPSSGCSMETHGRSPEKALVSVVTLQQLPKATQETFFFTLDKKPE